MGRENYNSYKRNNRFFKGEPGFTWNEINGIPSELVDISTELATKENAGAAAFQVNSHKAEVDPHAQYLTLSEANALYSPINASSDPWTWVKLASNSAVSTTAFADVSGMSFTATANTTYLVEVFGAFQTVATTTGISLALDVPTGSTVIGQVITSISATGLGGTEQIADATTTGATTGVRAINTNIPIRAKWVVAVGGTEGSVQLRQRSEVAGSNTVLQANLTILGRRTI